MSFLTHCTLSFDFNKNYLFYNNNQFIKLTTFMFSHTYRFFTNQIHYPLTSHQILTQQNIVSTYPVLAILPTTCTYDLLYK